MIGGCLQGAPYGLGTCAMAGHARQAALLRPAAVAVHDDGDMARDRSAPAQSLGALRGDSRAHLPRISFSLALEISSTSLIVSSVSFWTSCSSLFRSSSLISCFFSSCFR